MYRVFETIKVVDGKPLNLFYHQKRIDWTFQNYYKFVPFFSVEKISANLTFSDGINRLKIIYDPSNVEIQIFPYNRKRVDYFYIVELDHLDYKFKYENRDILEQYCTADYGEPIFLINGFITDTTFSNLVFFDGQKWWTPSTYLLWGTKREALIDSNKIGVSEIRFSDLRYFEKFCLINSMNELDEFSFSIDSIRY
ncbi:MULTISPECIES: aminotransferase class IV [Calditerrivibrio]|jgi:4-amino-4-deoxychorismate lyase|uniref:4-amino-4-deoxychorismate lyase n=1 Tax=Calditerrivibrio nitroreducens TaxID=477976 RepID=A0A2J6WR15_9BACT|nr:MAG: hypothetical protein C0187_00885 [Calditerrivibrio nitroreducens]